MDEKNQEPKEIEQKEDNSSENLKSSSTSRQSEITASTLVRLMGLASSTQISILEQKIDILNNKLSNLSSKLDKLSNITFDGSDFDRIDVQLSDIKSILKGGSSSTLGTSAINKTIDKK